MISSLLYHSLKTALYTMHLNSTVAGIIAFIVIGFLYRVFMPRRHR